jgi:DNA polymerase
MLVGEAPGAEEDRQGLPFVGRAGQLLTAMLHALGLRRDDVFIANILKCRPPNNRDPRPEEVAACEGFLRRQVALVRPRVILALGRVAGQNLLGIEAPLKALRGRIHPYGPLRVPVVVTYHPAYLLRNPADKRRAWEDMEVARGAAKGDRHAVRQEKGSAAPGDSRGVE